MPTPPDAQSHTGETDASSPSQKRAERWLVHLLPLVAQEGWTEDAARKAADAAGLGPQDRALAAPNGVSSLIEAFLARGDRAMTQAVQATEGGIRARLEEGVMAWLGAFAAHKHALRRAIGHGALPWNSPEALSRLWRLSDALWDAVGDTAQDYNRYTKRGLLAAVLPPVTLYWLPSEDEAAVRAFLRTRLTHAMTVGKTAGQMFGPLLDRIWPKPAE